MEMRLTVLCDNAVLPQLGLVAEHGFACLVETGSGRYLFDTGQGLALVNNARILDRELNNLQAIVLSHGHYDHAGGLPEALHRSGPVEVIAHPDLFSERYRSAGAQRRFIGLPYRREYLESLGARFRLVRDWTAIGPQVAVTGEVPRRAGAAGDRGLIAVRDGQSGPDPLADDLSLVVTTAKGVVVVLGCAHAGLVNILRRVGEKTGQKRIYAVLGGTHLGFAGEAEFEEAVAALDEFGVEKIGAAHCTGPQQAARLYARLGERVLFAAVGTVLEV
jgi:7,8-dihydropterin-6-yl-methyl-4-(beta-D-ribofuranosyl)aminobenzene 5'-phosphate synthase